MVVESELKALGAEVQAVELGYAQVQLPATLTLKEIDAQLKKCGLELIYEPESLLIEQTKIAVLDYLNHVQAKGNNAKKLSEYIALKVGKNYGYLSKIFSKYTTDTLESYYIHLRVEKVKELLDYDQLNASEIAMTLGYSSVHYLSNQFKRITGFSVSEYKRRVKIDRESLDSL
ncbi:helix-turn-helix domain-containing protein [Tunicatimonas pelagia]|uniref:helix-turn-helix domain-containing protein n=1 Tax=Tunicatimonas pelagia TaxID=931531 RepID=UPI0026667C15|nr:AraC family transcriptional regulator [Tunicatimonas pelagia]WKN45391.1 AraC family transcriptional regulator [Tunicatimonas pelagia]